MALLNKILIVFLLLNITQSYAQYDFVDPEYEPPCGKKNHPQIQPFIEHLFCWKDWELAKTIEEKQEMLNNLTGDRKPRTYTYLLDDEEGEVEDTLNSISIRPNSIQVIDYDRDGDEDFIYPVWVPWDKTYNTEFWTNVGGKWEFDFLVEGEITEMGESDGKPWFIVYHKLCCSDYTNYVKKLTPSETPGPSFQVSEKYAFIGRFRNVERRIKQKIKFDQHIPVEFPTQDTLFTTSRNIHGNKMIKKERSTFNPVIVLEGGSHGTILTEIVGPKNQKWYYIKLDRNTQLLKSAFQRDHRIGTIKGDASLIEYMGWVKAGENIQRE